MTASMPNLLGQTYWDGVNLLIAAGVLVPKMLGYFSTFPISGSWQKSQAPPGTILGQSIPPLTAVPPNAPLVLAMSEFPMGIAFPTVPAPAPASPPVMWTADSPLTVDDPNLTTDG